MITPITMIHIIGIALTLGPGLLAVMELIVGIENGAVDWEDLVTYGLLVSTGIFLVILGQELLSGAEACAVFLEAPK